ncbi:MAG: copper resistance protein CopC [Chloroflexi bacterium]|nr:copper resistance protein CopC [Chloroflexota bacterium]
MRIRKRFLFSLLTILVYCAGAVAPAYAHALLVRSNPAPNADLPAAPAQVELYFSEAVEPGLSTVSVLDSNGRTVDLGDVRVDPTNPTRMTVSLGSLQDGVYTVAWKAISATDGHLTSGSFPFAIGNVNAAALAAQVPKTSSQLPASALISKWLLLASLALIVGQISFVAFVWHPALKKSDEISAEIQEPRIWKTFSQVALIGLLFGLALSILSEAGQASGNELAWPWSPDAGRVLLDTRIGVIWLIRLGLAFLLVWLVKSRGSGWKRWAIFIAGLASFLSISLTAHAATEANPAIPVISDWIHMIGMSFWLGGLPFLFSGLRALKTLSDVIRTKLTSIAMERFSAMALASVAAIGVTGLYAAYLRVGSFRELYASIYGDALLVKQVFVGLLLVLAAVNLLFISPRLKKARLDGVGNAVLVTRFGKMVLAEIVLGSLLLLSVSLLTYLPPAKIIPPSFDLSGSANAGDLHVSINVSPGLVGQNAFTVNLTSNGQPVDAVKEALLRFTPSQTNVAPSEVQLLAAGNGNYTTKGSFLSLPGNWQIQVVVRRENKFDDYANFNFSVVAPGSNRESAATSNVAGGVILLDGLLFVLAMIPLKGNRILQLSASGLFSLVFVVAGIFYATRPVISANAQANPIAPDPQSIAAGKSLYEAHCVVCHGEDGKGDGPLGRTLIPRPADLTIHAVPGVHTDAQLYDWITNGFPGSAMPAWRAQLSDTDRWNLVNFIRTLAPKQN